MDHQTQINHVYNQHAQGFQHRFESDGARVTDIERALKLAEKEHGARVVEIGCGTGRDAKEIIARTNWYEGFDPATKLIQVAKKHVPTGRFVVADALTYEYPEDLDVVFAFASLLHVGREDMPAVFRKVATALRTGRIFDMRMRENPQYLAAVQTDEYGERMFFYYNLELLRSFAAPEFELVHHDRDYDDVRDVRWLGATFRKV